MNVHEYQAKEILGRYGIPIPPFATASTPTEAEQAMKALGMKRAVIKIQVHAGGRGKAGGVKFVQSVEEAVSCCEKLIGMRMVGPQTGKGGVVARRVLLAEPVEIAKEYYLGAVIDRNKGEAILIASQEGGMEIEEVARKDPGKILRLPILADGRIRGYLAIRLCKFMGWTGPVAKAGIRIAKGVAKAFCDTDADLLEINPLVLEESGPGRLWAVDTKLSVDDNALFRQQEIAGFFDPTQIPLAEATANEHGLSYIALEGEIGCMVNGAGLAMATMDSIRFYGGAPANFLDVGGGADVVKVKEGFKLILGDKNVKAVLVNIFGGIMDCAVIAEGVIAAVSEQGIRVPLIVRLEGTNVDEGRKMLEKSSFTIVSATGMADAAQKAVRYARGG
ncbi:MAG: ADP-forming succinate--CoA ligase subunit beta [Simkaniaceae bacterium]|nr:ADP-forming succinate--CoA ligase subunit beta [Simkaniaceae bacterium]